MNAPRSAAAWRRRGLRDGGLALVLAGTLLGCGGRGAPANVDTYPGAELLSQRARLSITSARSATPLPPEALAALDQILSTGSWSIDAADWTAVRTLAPVESAAMLTGVSADGSRRATRWEMTPPFCLRLPLGELQLELAGEPLRRRHRELPDGSPTMVWRDTSVPIGLWLEDDGRTLVAAAEQRPTDIVLRLEPGLGPSAAWWRSPELPAAVRQVTLADETRPVLTVATPGRLGVDVERLEAAELEVGVALERLAVGWERGRLVPETTPSRVRFAVDVVHAGARTRAWSRELSTYARFVDARVDLSAWKGRACRIEFVTETDTPEVESFAMWSTLRFRDADHAPAARPHLVLLDLDTLRADGLGCYGNPRDTSPRIDAWAAREATRFSDHVSVNNWTLPSTVSMLSGLPVSAHGVLRFPLGMGARHEPLAQRLAAAGYETLACSDGGFVAPEHGFATGFDRFVVRDQSPAEFERDGWSVELDWLRTRDSQRPVFLFLQSYKVHAPFLNDARFEDPAHPYRGPLAAEPVQTHHVHAARRANGGELSAADRRYLRDVYDAGVHRIDAVVGRFLDELPAIFGDEPYAVVITSDHGEALAERGTIGHGTSLHEEQLRVPLLVRPPFARARAVVDAPVSGLDLAPTLLGFAGLPASPELPGRDLFREPLRANHLRVSRHDEHAAAVRRLGLKLIADDRWEQRDLGAGLYDLTLDPDERSPLELRLDARDDQLREALERYASEHDLRAEPTSKSGAASTAHIDALIELGYIEGR